VVVFFVPLKGGEHMRIEIRSDSVLLDGYVNAVGRESRILPSPKGRFREVIVPKTFERALSKGNNVDLLFNHIKDRKLGSTATGELELREDNIGLRAIATVTDQQVIDKARAGELQGWSFGFHTNKDQWLDGGDDGVQKRMVEDIDLVEVSILDKTPAYLATTIEQRGEECFLTETRAEDFVANIEDKSQTNEEDKKQEEKKDEPVSYRAYELETILLQMKGRRNK
jgi:HK97 family phage prohead protease